MTTEAGIETVPVASDNSPMKAHIVCGICHGDGDPGFAYPMGTPAICGEKILGIWPAIGPKCPKCQKLKETHGFVHRYGGR